MGPKCSSNLDIELLDRRPDLVVVGLVGDLDHRTAATLRRMLTKELLNAGSVLVNLRRLQLTEPSPAVAFAAALDQADGRLALFDAAPRILQQLHATSVTNAVPYAPAREQTLNTLSTRPSWARSWINFEPRASVPRRARTLLREFCRAWQIPSEAVQVGAQVISELVNNAVEHAGTPGKVTIQFNSNQLTLAVHDLAPPAPQLQPHNLQTHRGQGLRLVQALTADWGVIECRGGKTVWAVVPTSENSGSHSSPRYRSAQAAFSAHALDPRSLTTHGAAVCGTVDLSVFLTCALVPPLTQTQS